MTELRLFSSPLTCPAWAQRRPPRTRRSRGRWLRSSKGRPSTRPSLRRPRPTGADPSCRASPDIPFPPRGNRRWKIWRAMLL